MAPQSGRRVIRPQPSPSTALEVKTATVVVVDEQHLLARSGGPVTRSRLVADLTALGVQPGAVVMFHTRMSALGYVAGLDAQCGEVSDQAASRDRAAGACEQVLFVHHNDNSGLDLRRSGR